jgi:hypothetical protein
MLAHPSPLSRCALLATLALTAVTVRADIVQSFAFNDFWNGIPTQTQNTRTVGPLNYSLYDGSQGELVGVTASVSFSGTGSWVLDTGSTSPELTVLMRGGQDFQILGWNRTDFVPFAGGTSEADKGTVGNGQITTYSGTPGQGDGFQWNGTISQSLFRDPFLGSGVATRQFETWQTFDHRLENAPPGTIYSARWDDYEWRGNLPLTYHTATTIPEPGALLLLGVAGCAAAMRRRRVIDVRA